MVKNKRSYDNLSSRRTDVSKKSQEEGISGEIQKSSTHRFVTKSFFHMIFLLIKQNWAHSHNFQNLVDVHANHDGVELRAHLLHASRNASYTHLTSVEKYIDISSAYLKDPRLASF